MPISRLIGLQRSREDKASRLRVHEGGCSDGGPVLGGHVALDENLSSGRQNLIGKVHALHRPGHRHRSNQTRIKEQRLFMALLFGEHWKLIMYGAGEKLVDADGVVFKSLAVLGRGTLHVGAERGENASVTDLQKHVFGEILLDHGLYRVFTFAPEKVKQLEFELLQLVVNGLSEQVIL